MILSISVTLRIWEMVWGTFLLAKWCRFRISKPFLNLGANLKFFKLLIFSQQLISPKLFYLGNPEDLRDGVGDIFIIVQFVEITYFFFYFPKIFSFSSWPPISNFLKFLKKLNISMTMRSWALIMVPLFSVSDPLSVKLTIFKIWPNFKLSIF